LDLETAGASVEFIKVDETSEAELARLEKLNVLIKEKHIPIANLDLHKPTHSEGQSFARLKLRKLDLAGAMADYNQAIRLDPKYSAAYDDRGNVKRQKGDLNDKERDDGEGERSCQAWC
jgi:hypothetical protein